MSALIHPASLFSVKRLKARWLSVQKMTGAEPSPIKVKGQAPIQSDFFYEYRTNVAAYPNWQAWLQRTRPKLLVLWGKRDLLFDPGEPERYHKDVPNAQVHVLDAGHFALDTKAGAIAGLVREFMKMQN